MRHTAFIAISTVSLLAATSCERVTEAQTSTFRDPARSAKDASFVTVDPVPRVRQASKHALLARGTSRALEEAGFRRYGLRCGIVEYRIRGAVNGRELVYFDRFGLRESKLTETVLSVLDRTETVRELTILDGAWATLIDLARRSGVRERDVTFEQVASSRDERDLAEIAQTMLRTMGGRRIGRELVLGRECDVWELPSVGGRTWVWKGLALRTELNGPEGSLVHEAVRLEADVDVPADVFDPPAGVTVQASNAVSGRGELAGRGTP